MADHLTKDVSCRRGPDLLWREIGGAREEERKRC